MCVAPTARGLFSYSPFGSARSSRLPPSRHALKSFVTLCLAVLWVPCCSLVGRGCALDFRLEMCGVLDVEHPLPAPAGEWGVLVRYVEHTCVSLCAPRGPEWNELVACVSCTSHSMCMCFPHVRLATVWFCGLNCQTTAVFVVHRPPASLLLFRSEAAGPAGAGTGAVAGAGGTRCAGTCLRAHVSVV
jgi:hypothetical protein